MKQGLLNIGVIACVMALCMATQSWGTISFAPGDYDNTGNTVTGTNAAPVYTNNQTTGLFRDVFWWGPAYNGGTSGVGSPDFINSGFNLVSNGGSPARAVVGPGPHTALNFTGVRIPTGGASFLSIYDRTPKAGDSLPGQNAQNQDVFDAAGIGGLTVSADVLFAPGGHSTSGGVVALYNEGQDALALLAQNSGGNNQDVPKVQLIWQSNGQGTTLTSINLPGLTTFVGDTDPNPTLGDHWYRVVMNLAVAGDAWNVVGTFFPHVDPADPNSALGPLITTLLYAGSLSNPSASDPAGNVLTNPGEIGVMAQTFGPFSDGVDTVHGGTGANPLVDNIGVSITNFGANDRRFGAIPEPLTMLGLLLGVGSVGAYIRKRRMA